MDAHDQPYSRNSGGDSTLSSSLSSGAIADRQLAIDLPLTFGLELEYTFAIPRTVSAPESNHDLAIEDDEIYVHEGSNLVPVKDIISWRLAPWRELQQASTIIQKRGGRLVRRYFKHETTDPYDEWFVTLESAAAMDGDRASIISEISNGKITSSTKDDYHFAGQELVSRVLRAPDIYSRRADAGPDMAEVRKMVNALQHKPGDDHHFMIHVENAGLHMHIGRPPKHLKDKEGYDRVANQPFDLHVLQHLAYILIEYEHVISLLHDPRRRGYPATKTDVIAESNRCAIWCHQHTCGLYPLPVLRMVQAIIFDPTMTITDLADLMSYTFIGRDVVDGMSRYKLVNWTNVSNEMTNQTIEFRQHQGTMDYKDIEQWVVFNTSLIRAAERMAAAAAAERSESPTIPFHRPTSSAESHVGMNVSMPRSFFFDNPRHITPRDLAWSMREAKRYATRYENEDAMLDQLFDLLQLRKSRRTYWRSRATKFSTPEYTSPDTYRACRECLDTYDADNDAHRPLENERMAYKTLTKLATDAEAHARRAGATILSRANANATPQRRAALQEELEHATRRSARAHRRVKESAARMITLRNIIDKAPGVVARSGRVEDLFAERAIPSKSEVAALDVFDERLRQGLPPTNDRGDGDVDMDDA